MLRAIEDRIEDGIFVNVFKKCVSVRDLVGGELSADEVAEVNAAYPDSISDDYVPRTFTAPPEEPMPIDEPVEPEAE